MKEVSTAVISHLPISDPSLLCSALSKCFIPVRIWSSHLNWYEPYIWNTVIHSVLVLYGCRYTQKCVSQVNLYCLISFTMPSQESPTKIVSPLSKFYKDRWAVCPQMLCKGLGYWGQLPPSSLHRGKSNLASKTDWTCANYLLGMVPVISNLSNHAMNWEDAKWHEFLLQTIPVTYQQRKINSSTVDIV